MNCDHVDESGACMREVLYGCGDCERCEDHQVVELDKSYLTKKDLKFIKSVIGISITLGISTTLFFAVSPYTSVFTSLQYVSFVLLGIFSVVQYFLLAYSVGRICNMTFPKGDGQ